MAKPKPMNSAMAKSRPMNLVSHNRLSASKNPPQDLSSPVNLESVEKEQGGAASIRKIDGEHKPGSNRMFSSEATGKHSKCRL